MAGEDNPNGAIPVALEEADGGAPNRLDEGGALPNGLLGKELAPKLLWSLEDIPYPVVVVAVVAGAPNPKVDVPNALLWVDAVPKALAPDVVTLVPKGPTPPNKEGGAGAAVTVLGELPKAD